MRFSPKFGYMSQAATWIVDFFFMSLLLVVASLPIVTFPAAVAALFGVARRLYLDGNVGVFFTFFKLFAGNFKQSMIAGGAVTALSILAVIDLRVAHIANGSLHFAFTSAILFVFLILAFITVNLFPLMVHVQTTTWRLLVLSLKLSIYKIHLTVANLLLLFGAFLVAARFPVSLIFLYPGVAAYATYWFAHRKFQSIQEQHNQHDGQSYEIAPPPMR